MKTRELVALLSKNEQKEIKQKLTENKRSTLSLLYLYILKTLEYDELDKESLFKAVFKDVYKEEKDYLLRNELRILNIFIEDYLVGIRQKEQIKEDTFTKGIALLELYNKRREINLFEKEWRALFKENTEKKLFKNIFQLLKLWIDFVAYNKALDVKFFEELMVFLKDYALYKDYALLEDYYEWEVKIKYISYVLNSLKSESIDYQLSTIIKVDANKLDDIHQLLILLTQAYNRNSSSESRINNYEQTLSILEKLIHSRPELIKRKYIVVNNLGVENFIKRDYEKSFHYYKNALEGVFKYRLDIPWQTMGFNYMSACLSTGNYQEIIEFYFLHQEELKKDIRYFSVIERFVCLAYLFLNKENEAMKVLTHNIFERPEIEYYYFKAIYTLVYIAKNEFDNAEREIVNTTKALKYKPYYTDAFDAFFKHCKKYIMTLLITDKAKKQTSLLSLKQLINETINKNLDGVEHPYKFLLHKIEQKLKMNS